MADGFQPMGAVPQGYGGILNGVVRGPNGTLVYAPQMGQPTSLPQIYNGILPSSSPVSPVGPGADWGALTGMLDDPIYSGNPGPYTPANPNYGQPPTSVAQTRAEQARSPALQAIQAQVPHANGTLVAGKDETRMPETPILAFNGDQANGLVPGGGIGGASGSSGSVSLASLLGGRGIGGPSLPQQSFLSGDPGQTDWSVANNGMQGVNGPVDAKYLPNDPRSKATTARLKALPKYAVNNAPGTFNRDTGTWNTGMPASSSSGLPQLGGGLMNGLGGLGGLLSGGLGNSLLGHIMSAITSQPDPNGAAQMGLRMIPGVGSALAPSMPMVNLNKVSPDSPAAGLLSRNGGGLADGAQVSFRNPESQQRWMTGY